MACFEVVLTQELVLFFKHTGTCGREGGGGGCTTSFHPLKGGEGGGGGSFTLTLVGAQTVSDPRISYCVAPPPP